MALRRIAIVNRGEAAMRLIHAVREINARRAASPGGEPPLETVALFTDGERSAMFAREADIAIGIGPASARPYLDHKVLERALLESGADAAWVGWGFVAEDAAFAEVCARIGVTFIGPSPEAMRTLGDKIGAKLLAESVGVPVAPWSDGEVADLESALAHAERIGYPMVLKAAAGGGGRGIRLVYSPADLTEVFERTRDEAARAFGSSTVFLEKLVTGARHIEVQVIADGQGTAWALGVRDCSVQRRNQKVIEESASPLLTPEQVRHVKTAAERLALAVNYAGAGTVEFLYQPASGTFAFLEVNTRLQVEHPVTELTTGTDLVALQLHVAGGGRLEGPAPAESGHAVEARLNAEDPDRDFAPAPGRISLLRMPTGPGVRVDTGVGEGDTIPADFDSMIAKIIATGPTREVALARLRRAIADTTVMIAGGTTNKSFILDLLDSPEVVDGPRAIKGHGHQPGATLSETGAGWADTGWIDRVRAAGGLVNTTDAAFALITAAIEAYEDDEAAERAQFLATAAGGRPQAGHDIGREFDFRLRGTSYSVRAAQIGPARYRIRVEDAAGALGHTGVDVDVVRLDDYDRRLTVGARTVRITTACSGIDHVVEVDGVAHRVTRDEAGVLRAPAPALVVSVGVEAGQEVAAGAAVVVLESMKMETVLPAPFAGRVREVLCAANDQVETGAPLLRLDPIAGHEDADDAASGPALELHTGGADASAEPTTARARRCLDGLVAQLLGFDLAAEDGRAFVTQYRRARTEILAGGGTVLDDELDVLSIYAELCELARNRPGDAERDDLRVHSPREHFHVYLHSLDAEREHLPASFRDRLTRVLARYGVTDPARTPQLEEAVFRVFLAQQRLATHSTIVGALLERWMHEDPPIAEAERAREVLDRLAAATQLRFPAIGDLARSVRFRWFDAPVARAERARVDADVRARLARLAGLDGAATPALTAEDVEAELGILVDSPEPLIHLLAERLCTSLTGEGALPEVEPLLQVLVRRHYRDYTLDGLRDFTVATSAGRRRPVVTADYTLDGRPSHLITTIATIDEVDDGAGRLVGELLASTPADRQAVVDLYLAWPGAPETLDEAQQVLRGVLARLPWAGTVRRIAVAVACGHGKILHQFTLRPAAYDPATSAGAAAAGGAATGAVHELTEDELVRGLHPMVARRLHLWRLRKFDIRRLPAPTGVLLYHCTAPGNPSDQRLVAMAQIRQLTLVRDTAGRVTGLPQAERFVASAVEAIRRARAELASDLPRGVRLDTNHVWMQLWPVIDAPLEQLTALRQSIAPLTVGAGLEEVVVQGRIRDNEGRPVTAAARFWYQPGSGVSHSVTAPPTTELEPLDDYAQKVQRSRRRNTVYPYELVPLLTGRDGSWQEYDLEPAGIVDGPSYGRLTPVNRPAGRNTAGIVVGVATAVTARHPEGMRRVVLAGDPTRSLGALSEGECARVCAALDLAEREGMPVEWFALSSGARISMDSGTENMDWVARALRRIVEFTQGGGEINIVVTGINVGAQPYWNAEATMLMHTKGILVMTPDAAMVLTGKQSLDYSGGVSAEDNFGIGGYDRVMGPNGQAQYWAPDLAGACDVLFAHYDHAYVVPGERFPRPASTIDSRDRDVCVYPHPAGDGGFITVGEIFSAAANPERKKAFDIRTVLHAVADADHPTLERWAGMADADTSVVLDAHLGGYPVTLLGIESKPVPRRGFPPSDGPDSWTAGTLFPRSSKKTARAINAASGNRPLVVLANLSGFDGSPESMRKLQLEYGAEIGRAVVNFDGPIVFCVISRYHGGAFVVFSKTLNDNMQILAVDGSYASVIGGAPAAAVVFSGEVDRRTAADPRVRELEARLAAASDIDRGRLRAELAETRASVRSQKLGEVATEFDGVHSIHRAVQVGSVDAVIAPTRLRPELIDAVERGLAKAQG